ncbi:MAG TPA: tetratricopeptide repeat protein [Coriobacteriia bacterium]|jgi:tetratricopeptide (TPR) repeat protein
MSPENESALPSLAVPRTRLEVLDLVTRIIFWTLLAGLLGLGGFFGYTVWDTNQQAILSNPARRTVESLKVTVSKKPNDAYARVRLAEAMGQAGMYDEAVVQLRAALQIDPKYVGAYEDLALIAGKKKDWASAEAYLLKVLDLTSQGDAAQYTRVNERREAAYFYLGEVALERKHYDDAAGYFKQALLIRRDASDTYVRLAQAYEGLGDNDQALKQLTIAIAYDPNFPQARYEIGKLLLEQKNEAAAAESFRKSLTAQPKDNPAQQALDALGPIEKWLGQAKDAYAKKDFAAVLSSVRVAVAIDPSNYEAQRLKAASAESTGDTKMAISTYQEMLKLKPNDPDVLAALKRLGAKPEGAAQ